MDTHTSVYRKSAPSTALAGSSVTVRRAPVVAADDPALDSAISGGFEELLALIDDTRDREEQGDSFSPEEADALGAEAQDLAERIVAQVLQAAAKHGVDIKS